MYGVCVLNLVREFLVMARRRHICGGVPNLNAWRISCSWEVLFGVRCIYLAGMRRCRTACRCLVLHESSRLPGACRAHTLYATMPRCGCARARLAKTSRRFSRSWRGAVAAARLRAGFVAACVVNATIRRACAKFSTS